MRRVFRWISQRYYRRKVRAAMKTVKKLDVLMRKAGFKRHERRQFWREFVKANIGEKLTALDAFTEGGREH